MLDEAEVTRGPEPATDLLAEGPMLADDVQPRAAPALDDVEHHVVAVVPANLGGKPGRRGFDGSGMTIAEVTGVERYTPCAIFYEAFSIPGKSSGYIGGTSCRMMRPDLTTRTTVMHDSLDKPTPPPSPYAEKGAAEAEYLHGMCAELAAMAERARFKKLAEALGVAAAEAHRVALRHNVEATLDEPASA